MTKMFHWTKIKSLHIDTPFKKESSLKFNTWTNKGWHEVTYTNTTKEKKQLKEEDYLKKGSTTHCTSYINFSGRHWCDAMRKLMFSKSTFCLFLWQLVQVLLWFQIRPSGTFFKNFSPISDWGYQKDSVTCWMLLQDILISLCTHHPTPKTIIVFRVWN